MEFPGLHQEPSSVFEARPWTSPTNKDPAVIHRGFLFFTAPYTQTGRDTGTR